MRITPAVLATVASLVAAASAHAHIQVTPTVAAPADAVLFELLVPNEDSERTTDVTLKIPGGVLPFSFENTPGWTRKVTQADDGSTDTVRWHGRLAKDGFVRFAFLAATPERPGELAWKAIQTYSNGEKVRWIGAPDTEQPAAVTQIRSGIPKQNAGGEVVHDGAGSTTTPAQTPVESGATTSTAAEDDSADALEIATLVVAALALAIGLAGLFRTRRL